MVDFSGSFDNSYTYVDTYNQFKNLYIISGATNNQLPNVGFISVSLGSGFLQADNDRRAYNLTIHDCTFKNNIGPIVSINYDFGVESKNPL